MNTACHTAAWRPTSLALTLMFLPPSITEFICSKASCAASGTSYSTKAKPWTRGSTVRLRELGVRWGRWVPGTGQTKSHLVLHGDRIPRHVNALDGSKGSKGLANGVLPQFIVDGAYVDPAHDSQCPLPLSCHLERDTRGERETLACEGVARGGAAYSPPGPPTQLHCGEGSPQGSRVQAQALQSG